MSPETEAGKRLLIKYGLPVEADAEVAAIEQEVRHRIAGAVRGLPDASMASSGTPARLVGHVSRASVLAAVESPETP